MESFKVTPADRGTIEMKLGQVGKMMHGPTSAYNPRLLTSALQRIIDGKADELKEEDHELEDFLLRTQLKDSKPLFISCGEVARSMAALPESQYPNPKASNAQLSLICRSKRPMPTRMATEIVRCLTEMHGSRLNGDFGEISFRFGDIVSRHNHRVFEKHHHQGQAPA